MADFNIDEILSGYEGKTSKAKSSGALDIDSLLSGFKSSEPVAAVTKTERPRVVIDTTPRPPISGISKEASDEINSQRAVKGGENPRRALPTTNIQEAAYEAELAGKEMLDSGIQDLGSGHPYKGMGKTALGVVMRLTAPMSGIVEGGVGTPIADITGNKSIGDRAALVAGFAVPADKGIGTLSKVSSGLPVVNKLSRYPKDKALSQIVEHIGPENLPMVVSAMKSNPRLGPADLSPRVLQDAQHLFASDGPQINYLKKTSDARMSTRKSTIEEAYDTAGGISPNLAQKITDLAGAAKKVGSEQINPLVKAAKPVNLAPTISNIDAILKQGVMSKISEGTTLAVSDVKEALGRARNLLTNGKETRTGASDIHELQKSLRRQAWDKINSGDPAQREIGHALMKVRNDIVADVDKASPGYAKALDNYRDEMHIADAFKAGHDKILTSSKKIENDPSFVKKWFDGLNEYEQQAVKEGVRAAAYTEMGVAKNAALAGESVMRSDFNKAKMEIILGKEEASKLFKALDDERNIANTHNKIIEGSQTAMRTASKEGRALPTLKDIGTNLAVGTGMETANILAHGTPGVGTAILTGLNLANRGSHAVKEKIAREINTRYAKFALPTEGPSRDELIRNLEAMIPKPKLSMLNKVRASLPASQP